MSDDLVARLRSAGEAMADDLSAGIDLCAEAADRIEQLEAAMRSIVERCGNSGRGDEFVNDRIIERVEEIAVEAMAKP